MTRPAIRKPVVVAQQHGISITRQQSEFGAIYAARRGEAPALFTTNRQAEALAWLAGYAQARQEAAAT